MQWNHWQKFSLPFCWAKHKISFPIHTNAMNKRFFLYGICGWTLEICWTGFCSFLAGDLSLTAKTYLWMFPIYGLAVLAEPAFLWMHHHPIWLRVLIYPICIFAVEYVTGWLLLTFIGVCPWDYSGQPTSIHGLIRLDYTPLWMLMGFILETVCVTIRGMQTESPAAGLPVALHVRQKSNRK